VIGGAAMEAAIWGSAGMMPAARLASLPVV